jgi:hypothetical protein
MTASTNRTIWTVALITLLGLVIWKAWPAIKNALNRIGSGGSGGGGATTANGYLPQQNPYGQGGSGSPFGGSLGGGPGGSSYPGSGLGVTPSSFSDWLSSIEQEGYDNISDSALGYGPNDIADSDYANELSTLDSEGISATDSDYGGDLSNFDTSSAAWQDFQDYYLVTQDVPGDDGGNGGDGGDDQGDGFTGGGPGDTY